MLQSAWLQVLASAPQIRKLRLLNVKCFSFSFFMSILQACRKLPHCAMYLRSVTESLSKKPIDAVSCK